MPPGRAARPRHARRRQRRPGRGAAPPGTRGEPHSHPAGMPSAKPRPCPPETSAYQRRSGLPLPGAASAGLPAGTACTPGARRGVPVPAAGPDRRSPGSEGIAAAPGPMSGRSAGQACIDWRIACAAGGRERARRTRTRGPQHRSPAGVGRAGGHRRAPPHLLEQRPPGRRRPPRREIQATRPPRPSAACGPDSPPRARPPGGNVGRPSAGSCQRALAAATSRATVVRAAAAAARAGRPGSSASSPTTDRCHISAGCQSCRRLDATALNRVTAAAWVKAAEALDAAVLAALYAPDGTFDDPPEHRPDRAGVQATYSEVLGYERSWRSTPPSCSSERHGAVVGWTYTWCNTSIAPCPQPSTVTITTGVSTVFRTVDGAHHQRDDLLHRGRRAELTKSAAGWPRSPTNDCDAISEGDHLVGPHRPGRQLGHR